MSYQKWADQKQKLAVAKAWLKNKDKIDSQSNSRYSRYVQVGRGTFQFCGQAYAGANNYHEMPESLAHEVAEILKGDMVSIVERAIEAMERKKVKLGEEAKEEIEGFLNEITNDN